MAIFATSKSTFPIHFLIFNLLTLIPISTLSLETLTTTTNLNFDPQIVRLGDAAISGNGSFVQLATPNVSSSGLLFYKDPFKVLRSSFSTDFEFSFSGNLVDLSLVMGPFDFVSKFLGHGSFDVLNKKGYLGIEFGASVDGNGGNSNDIAVLVKVNKEPLGHFVTKRGQKLKSWIDYDASSKRLEIRISELTDKRPYGPIIASALDFSKMWGDSVVYVALGSRNDGSSSESCDVYSWRIKLRKVPNWMHSLPANPHGSIDNGNGSGNESLRVHRRKFCPLTILAGLIFATGCGALLAFVVLFMWAIFVSRCTVFPIEGKVQPVDFRYEKISVVVEKDGEVVKN